VNNMPGSGFRHAAIGARLWKQDKKAAERELDGYNCEGEARSG
jgi:hypothetical protein